VLTARCDFVWELLIDFAARWELASERARTGSVQWWKYFRVRGMNSRA
jgi:hypothetical protein